MSRYRIGMAHYLMGKYGDAICAFSDSLAIAPQDDDMYIADVYWLVLSQLRAGQADEAQKTLQQHYRPDMYVGHPRRMKKPCAWRRDLHRWRICWQSWMRNRTIYSLP